MINKEILEDLANDCPCDGKKWCFLRELIKHTSLSDRQAEQWRLFYDYKYMQSKKIGKDVSEEKGENNLFIEFIGLYAKKFDDVYREGMRNGELFEQVFGFKKLHTDEDVENFYKQ